MAPRSASAAPAAAASVDDGEPAHSEESDDDEEAESKEEATASPPPQQARNNDDEDYSSFTTLLFSDRGTTLPVWMLETDDEFNQLVRQRKQLSTLQPGDPATVKQLQVIFDGYRKCIVTNTLETYLIFLSWASHIADIHDDDDKLAHGAALQNFIRDVEHISDQKGSLSAVGHRILVAAYIWLHSHVWDWWDQHRSRVSIKMIASCTVRAISDEFLLGRLLRILMLNEHKAKAEVSALAKDIVDEDGIAAWDIKAKALTFHVFHCDNWEAGTVKQAKERQWIKAGTLRQHKRWTDMCDRKEKAIRALTILSIGSVAKKAGGVDTFEVHFSSKESLWLSHDNIRALKVKQWARVLDAEDEAPIVEEKKEEAKEQPQPTPEQQKVLEMEEQLKEEHRLRVQEHQLRIEAEKKLQLLLQEREKERGEQQRRQRQQHRERARETAQLLERLGELSARMDNELRQEVLQLVHALQGKQSEDPAEEAKEAPQRLAATEEVKEAPPEAAEDDAEDGAGDEAAEDDAAAATRPPAIGSKRKQVHGGASAGKKLRR